MWGVLVRQNYTDSFIFLSGVIQKVSKLIIQMQENFLLTKICASFNSMNWGGTEDLALALGYGKPLIKTIMQNKI